MMGILLSLLAAAGASAAGIDVRVVVDDPGATERGHTCTAWRSAKGFPDDDSVAVATARSEKVDGRWTCALVLPGSGRYAIGVMDDANGNGRVDTNWIGRPLEGWGTSNNVTPALRGPTFEESVAELVQGSSLSIQVHR